MAVPYSRLLFGIIPWYSILIVCGILLASYLAGKEEKRLRLPKDTAIDITLAVIPAGIIGARLYYVLMTLDYYTSHPREIFAIWEGGLAIYGAVIGGLFVILLMAKRRKLSFLTLCDMLMPGLLLAQAIGRWGNYFNQEAYGPLILNPSFCFFPLGVYIKDLQEWHMATFFYESLWNFCGFLIMWFGLRKRQNHRGNMLLWYLVIYGSGRFLIEQLREDSLYLWGFRISQWLSFGMVLAGFAILLLRSVSSDTPHRKLLPLVSPTFAVHLLLMNAPLPWGILWGCTTVLGFLLLRKQKRSVCFFILPVMMEALGLILSMNLLHLPGSMGSHAARVLCTAALPFYAIALCERKNSMDEPEPELIS